MHTNKGQLISVTIFIKMFVMIIALQRRVVTKSYLSRGRFPSSLFSMVSKNSGTVENSVASSSRLMSVEGSSNSSSVMPITVLSGFLGAGKTSFLQHTLSGRQDKTFGLVVNDMATINVDAKQIRRQSLSSEDGIDTMELQDGCVCCTLAEDLIASVSKLVSMSDLKNTRYDHIVVECSGIAEPRKIRDLFQQAEDYGFELLKKIRLDTLITAVDATVFLDLFGTDEDIAGNRRLAYKEEESAPPGVTYLDGSDQRKVTDLLLEQVECSDIVLINKCDLLRDPSDIELVKKIISCINPSAKVFSCVRGEVVNPLSLIGSAGGQGAANWGVLDEHRQLVKAAAGLNTAECSAADCKDPTHDHEHSHSRSAEAECSAADCKDPTHDHEHSHSHSAEAECSAVDCKDPTHDHEHSHSHSAEAECSAIDCKDPTHDHEHSHSHSAEAECSVVECNDPTHDHNHSHSHSSTVTTAEERFGITSFVYKRRRPFHPIRFSMFLQGLGKLSVKGVAELSLVHASSDGSTAQLVGNMSASLVRAQRALIRSKGFVWMATSGAAAYFMSHAGQYLELLVLGRWWADIDRAEWPAALQSEIAVDFDPVGSHGDRRQELVFIGQFGKDQSNSQQALQEVLDSCLLTDDEMSAYEQVVKDGDDALRQHFVPDFQA